MRELPSLDLKQRANSKFLSEPSLVRQQTVGEREGNKVEIWEYKVDAVNGIRARNIIRRYVRSNYPHVKNILSPSVEDIDNTEQSKLTQFFPETFQLKVHQVEVMVVL